MNEENKKLLSQLQHIMRWCKCNWKCSKKYWTIYNPVVHNQLLLGWQKGTSRSEL